MAKALHNSLILVLSLSMSIAAGEILMRSLDDIDILIFKNFIDDEIVAGRLSEKARFDDNLGWAMVDNFRSAELNTTHYGIRFNKKTAPDLKRGAIIAVGDSFAAGSEVSDEHSWPAHLEQMLGEPVYNGGVGGYGTDQIILRGNDLFDILSPKLVIIGFLAGDINRSNFKVYYRPRPYFKVINDELVRFNDPVPGLTGFPKRKISFHSMNQVLGYSYSYFKIWRVIDPSSEAYIEYQKADNDPIAVTCLLLDKFYKKIQKNNANAILLIQYGGPINHKRTSPPSHALEVSKCANEIGLPVIDEFETMHEIAQSDFERFKSLYARGADGKTFGHMSSDGNKIVAGLIYNFLKKQVID